MISGACNFGKLAISSEAVQSIYHAKVQLLLILIETLYLENLLQMIHDETPFREGNISLTVSDIQEVDAIISTFDAFETKESGPLILTWAVFLCLISSLPDKQEHDVLMVLPVSKYFLSYILPFYISPNVNHTLVLCYRKLIMWVMFAKLLELHLYLILMKSFTVIS